MRRRLAHFTLWLSLFGLFLSFAAYSSGSGRPSALLISLLVLWKSASILRRPPEHFDPSKRFRTLRRLGLIRKGPEETS